MEHLKSQLRVSLAQKSVAGCKPENQDSLGARIPEGPALSHKGVALAIADGVSSSASARQASQAAITGFLNDYYATPDTWSTRRSATQVIQSLNQYLWGQSRNSIRQEGHLTTFSVLILKGDKCYVFHVGDTRVYLWRDGILEQITRDHSQKLGPDSSYLSRALGADPHLSVDMHSIELQAGDVFMLSSDGVHAVLHHEALQARLNKLGDIDAAVEDIIARAESAGSQDNLSVQLVRVESQGSAGQDDAFAALSNLPFPPPLEPGNILDGYRIRKILHESERSQVYQVEDTFSGETLVMKTPSVSYVDDPAYIERFVLESWIGLRIRNQHVARVVESDRARSCLYYLSEYIGGPTLAELIRQRAPLAVSDSVELTEQLIKGTRGFHRRDILHQDLKPANVVIGTRGAVIVDFGSCRAFGIEEMGEPFARQTAAGTLDYSAPEFRRGEAGGTRSDQYSLAVMLYEMLTRKLPDVGAPYEAARRHNPLIPVWLDRALEKALSADSQQRYDSLSEWLLDLKRPNPKWLGPEERPLIERHPLRFWQFAAALGWVAALALLFRLLVSPTG